MSEQLTREELMQRALDHENEQEPKPSASDEALAGSPAGTDTPAGASAPVAAVDTTPSIEELTDEQIEAVLQKRGKKVVSAEATTDLSEKEKKEKREKDKIKWALDSNAITLEEYNRYQQDKNKTPRQIVLDKYIADRKDSGKSVEQLEAEFSQLYYENADEEYSYLRESRAADMEREAQRILQAQHSKLYSLDKKFDDHVAAEQTNTRTAQERQQKLQQYESDVKKVFSNFNKRTLQIREDDDSVESFDFELPQNLVKQVQDQFLSEAVATKLIGSTEEEIQDAVDAALTRLTLSQTISFAAKKYHADKMRARQIGRRHMSPDEVASGSPAVERDSQAYEMVEQFLPEAVKQVQQNG